MCPSLVGGFTRGDDEEHHDDDDVKMIGRLIRQSEGEHDDGDHLEDHFDHIE